MPTGSDDEVLMRLHEDGKCKEIRDQRIFFPEDARNSRGELLSKSERTVMKKQAKKICRQCPMRTACLEYAVKYDERDGIWGAMSYHERSAYARHKNTVDLMGEALSA